MDPLSDMLGGIRAEGACVNQVSLEPPWAIRFAEGGALTLLTAVRGEGVLVLADGTEHKLNEGSTALVRGDEPFHLADSAAAMDGPIKVLSGNGYETVCELSLDESDATTAVIVGTYRTTCTRQERLLRTLPSALVVDEDTTDATKPEVATLGGWLDAVTDALRRRRGPGGQALIDRLLDWGLVCTLACWFEHQGADAPAWYRGAQDPVAGPALEAIHNRPQHLWTVGALAAEAKVSRAHLAKRFAEVMGQPPLKYLTEWRMYTAEDLLSDSDMSVAEVARAVGYADPFAFSTAFKRHRGTSPRQYRSAVV
ncbi:AraC family transcriptional regulator [Stackebrandtia nassauensis]|uniref:Transcriptional regulator, AraC family n=1 Tax=Stackebrandtia nassauensis (strain DSM 44728 / CIP 108903 / NRRL B-16338 / NBRC 102104 / LLR-40K-21) TaxID=446470 RepID=D3Q4I0_STANL|nr:AraC family transcriptional regulator [Stackebrandtia nassauensis]ADD40140.1 transcriptional regulator, AraC family [Stackebrandtia nassauensis DSM 44728]